ncbi:MAG: alcohol dehydrogenase catalytic domain-containing protein [Anaerolineaceae bacterium]|nr:alcohol dehydrogenase catalytic domain-containing protein [Anaerolineaceae bacterium]
MRALVYNKQLHLETDFPLPQPQGDEALLRIRKGGICNTDLELIDGMYDFSGVLGHEFVAEVLQGPAHWVGKRVVGEINIGCGQCDFCMAGIPSQCRHRQAIGIHNHAGAFADQLTLPVRNLHHVPDTVSDDQAVFVEPLAAVTQILEAVHISPADRVVVLGLGKLGMLAVQVLKLTGADVVGVVRHEKQVEMLRRWGIPAVHKEDLEPERAHIVVDCTGQASGITDALELVRSRGIIVLKSTYHGTPQVDMTQITVREIRIVGSRCGSFPTALRLLEGGLVDITSLIDACFDFDQALDAMRYARTPGTLKVLLDF